MNFPQGQIPEPKFDVKIASLLSLKGIYVAMVSVRMVEGVRQKGENLMNIFCFEPLVLVWSCRRDS